MKQFRQSTLVIAQTLCIAILIMFAVGPTGGQEKETQRAELVVQTGNADDAHFFSFSLDGKYLAISNNFTTKLWNIATGQELRALQGGEATFSPDGRTLATSSGAAFKFWHWRTGQELRTVKSSSLATRIG